MFDIKNDGVVVQKERVEKWEYTKYPPHSKFLLWKNLKYLFIITIMISGACSILFLDDNLIDYSYFLLIFLLSLTVVPSIWSTVKEWKCGKYWNIEE